jgi:hypothetical protein
MHHFNPISAKATVTSLSSHPLKVNQGSNWIFKPVKPSGSGSAKEPQNQGTDSARKRKYRGIGSAIKTQEVLQDPEYSVVAGYVTRRRGDNTIRAEPPPANPQRTTTLSRHQDSTRRRRISKRHENGSGSDSDSDPDRRLENNGEGAGVARRRREDPQSVLLEHDSVRDLEESARYQLHLRLAPVAKIWDQVCSQRDSSQATILTDTRHLVKEYEESINKTSSALLASPNAKTESSYGQALQNSFNDWDSQSKTMLVKSDISKWDKIRDDFLNQALYSNANAEERLSGNDQTAEAVGNPSDYLKDVIDKVELGVATRCARFHHDANKELREFIDVPIMRVHLIPIVQTLHESLREELRRSKDWSMPDWGTKGAAVIFMLENSLLTGEELADKMIFQVMATDSINVRVAGSKMIFAVSPDGAGRVR